MAILALVLLQAVVPAAATRPVAPQQHSILVDPCASASDEKGRDVIVCGHPDAISPRLPLRDYRGPPDHAVPSNPEMTGAVALNGPGVGRECGAYGEGCPVGGGGYIIPKAIEGLAGAVKAAFAKKPDRRGRVTIDLDGPPPPIPTGALRP